MTQKRKAEAFAGFAFLALLAGFAAGAVFPGLKAVAVAAGFLGYVVCGRKAMILAKADDVVFVPRRLWNPRPVSGSAVAAGFVAGTIGSFLLAQSAGSGRELGGGRSERQASSTSNTDLLHFPQSSNPKRPARS